MYSLGRVIETEINTKWFPLKPKNFWSITLLLYFLHFKRRLLFFLLMFRSYYLIQVCIVFSRLMFKLHPLCCRPSLSASPCLSVPHTVTDKPCNPSLLIVDLSVWILYLWGLCGSVGKEFFEDTQYFYYWMPKSSLQWCNFHPLKHFRNISYISSHEEDLLFYTTSIFKLQML